MNYKQSKTLLVSSLVALAAPAAFADISVFIDKSVPNVLTFSLSGDLPSVTTPTIAASVLYIHASSGGTWAPGGIDASNFVNNGSSLGDDGMNNVIAQLLSISGWGNTDLFALSYAGGLASNDVVTNGTNAFSISLDPADYTAFTGVGSFDISWGFAGAVSGSFVKGPDVGTVIVGVPEPGTALLGAIGGGALLMRRRRRA